MDKNKIISLDNNNRFYVKIILEYKVIYKKSINFFEEKKILKQFL